MSAKVVLLCEDAQTESFVRRFLRPRNIRHRDVFAKPLPHGAQSGEQWVRTQFPKELKAIRARQGAWLVVVIDADTRTTEAIHVWLNDECRTRGVPARTPDDPVVVAVPKRNIETWFRFLKTGERPSEESSTRASIGLATVILLRRSCSACATRNKSCRRRPRHHLLRPVPNIASSSPDPHART